LTQNETIWLLVGFIQFGVMGFVSYWTRRVQRLEAAITMSLEARTALMLEYQGRLSRLEAQFDHIANALDRIERRFDREDTRKHEEET